MNIKLGIEIDGGDFSSRENLPTVIEFAKNNKDTIIYVFSKDNLEKHINQKNINFVKCENQIDEDDSILTIRKKKNSSMIKMINYLKEGKIDSALSAGNSGTLFASSTTILGSIEKGIRPAFTPLITNVKTNEKMIILDGGANIENSSEDIYWYAKLGSAVIRNYAKKEPKVGLLNNGTENKKGNKEHQEFFTKLIESQDINFIGNIEPRNLLTSEANVLVTDGWSGNMIIKSYEGMAKSMLHVLKKEFKKNLKFKLAALILKPAFKNTNKYFDYREYGASLVLGVNGIVLKMHGESDKLAFKNALSYSKELVKSDFLNSIKL